MSFSESVYRCRHCERVAKTVSTKRLYFYSSDIYQCKKCISSEYKKRAKAAKEFGMTEQKIQSNIIKYLESEGHYVVKVITASKKGVPDLIACINGRFVAIEVKRPETKTGTSKLQEYNLKKVDKAGGYTLVAWSLDVVKTFLQSNEELR